MTTEVIIEESGTDVNVIINETETVVLYENTTNLVEIGYVGAGAAVDSVNGKVGHVLLQGKDINFVLANSDQARGRLS